MEFLYNMLQHEGVAVACVFGSMDQVIKDESSYCMMSGSQHSIVCMVVAETLLHLEFLCDTCVRLPVRFV